MTIRQELICRLISQELQRSKRNCESPTQADYTYWCGYRDGLDKAHSLAQYAKGTDGVTRYSSQCSSLASITRDIGQSDREGERRRRSPSC